MNNAQFDLDQYSFYEVAEENEIHPGERLFIEIGDHPIVLLNIDNKLFAIGDVCTHDDGPLGDGEIDGWAIICPRHGARFDVRTGAVLAFPAVQPAPVFPVRVVDGHIEIGIPNGQTRR
jgi:3-phenylpropionate/trans-cinnamate dioxygenase ferredoxin component